MQPSPGAAEDHDRDHPLVLPSVVYHLSLFFLVLGNLLATATLFIPIWKYDEGAVIDNSCIAAWMPATVVNTESKQRQYGLLGIRVNDDTKAWGSIADSVCVDLDHKLLDYKSETCRAEMRIQCYEYSSLKDVSMAMLIIQMFSCIFCAIGLFVVCFSKPRKVGGCTLALFSLSVCLPLVMNLVWFFVTDAAFSQLAIHGIPTTKVHVGYSLHISGVGVLLVGTVIYGVIVIPQVLNYDPAQEKIDRRNKKMKHAKILANGQRCKLSPVSMNFPPPPGFAPCAPAGGYSGGWGQPSNWPQQPQSAYTLQVHAYGGASAKQSQLGAGGYAPPTSYGAHSPPVNQDWGYGLHNREIRESPLNIMPDLPPSNQGRW